MKTKLLIAALCFISHLNNAQTTAIPDNNFEQALITLGYDTAPIDGYISTATINSITHLSISNKNISDLTGIEDFTMLTYLNCSFNNLDNLDVSNNTQLTYVNCRYNDIVDLNLSNLSSLETLRCSANWIETLDLSDNLALEYLKSQHNVRLSHLDLSAHQNLIYVNCFGSELYSLDMKNGNNTNIIIFDVRNNVFLECVQVDDVNYSNTFWTFINFQTSFSEDCRYDDTYVPDDNFEQALIDLGYDSGPLDDYVPTSNISSVTNLNVYNENISDLTGIEDFINLDVLKCRNNDLTTLNLSENTLLTEVDCSGNNISSLAFYSNPLLEKVKCYSNNMSSLNVSYNPSLNYLNCANNDLTSLNVSNNTELITLFCFQNNIVDLDVSHSPDLNILFCVQNALESLNVKNGNNSNMALFGTSSNPNLTCIQVDNVSYSRNNWTNIDPQTRYKTNCSKNNPFFRQQDISIYPNPTKGNITIQSSRTDTLLNIEVYNTLGNQMKVNTKRKNSLDLSHLPKGTYIIVLNYDNERVSKIIYKE